MKTTIFEGAPTISPAGTMHESTILGAITRYWEYGDQDGAPLVLIHGFRGDHHGLELIAANLSSFRVIIPDLPGFGKSEPLEGVEHSVDTYALWLSQFLKAVVGGHKVYLVGHSFGSMVAAATATKYSNQIARLALINPISEPALESGQKLMSVLAQGYYQLGAALPERLGFALLRSSLVTRVTSEFMMKTQDHDLRNFINLQHKAYFGAFASRQAVLEAYKASISQTATDYAAHIDLPTLTIVAEQDDLGSMSSQEKLLGHLKNGKMQVIPEVGHLVHYETPRRAASYIKNFWEEQEEQ